MANKRKKWEGMNEELFVKLQLKLLNTIKKQDCYLVKALVIEEISKDNYYFWLKKYKSNKRVKELHSLIRTYGEVRAIDEPNPIKSAFMLNNAFGYMTTKEAKDLDLRKKEINHKIKMDKEKLKDKDNPLQITVNMNSDEY